MQQHCIGWGSTGDHFITCVKFETAGQPLESSSTKAQSQVYAQYNSSCTINIQHNSNDSHECGRRWRWRWRRLVHVNKAWLVVTFNAQSKLDL